MPLSTWKLTINFIAIFEKIMECLPLDLCDLDKDQEFRIELANEWDTEGEKWKNFKNLTILNK